MFRWVLALALALPWVRFTPQKMRWRRRARVVLPLLDGPDIPIMVAFWGGSWDIVSLSVSGGGGSEVKESSRAWRGVWFLSA